MENPASDTGFIPPLLAPVDHTGVYICGGLGVAVLVGYGAYQGVKILWVRNNFW